MGMTRRDITGKRFGRLVAIRQDIKLRWLYRCDCGTEKVIRMNAVNMGRTRSCGCSREHHGMYTAPEYTAWAAMLNRCYDKNMPTYKRYGGRGIRVCREWKKSFSAFFKSMGPRPKGFSIDRIDNNGNYEPTNCRWADRVTQMRNTRNNKMYTAFGKTQCLAAWAEESGVNKITLSNRIRTGVDFKTAISTPSRLKPRRLDDGRARYL